MRSPGCTVYGSALRLLQADLDFAAVIAVDDTDTVRDMNALFDAETAASENEARRARGDLRRKTARK